MRIEVTTDQHGLPMCGEPFVGIGALYIYHGQKKEPHPFHIKSNWMPPVQPSISLKSYLVTVKAQLAEITVTKPKNNLSRNEVTALKELKNNFALNL